MTLQYSLGRSLDDQRFLYFANNLPSPSGTNPENFVPPGHGKPSTRKRNARRRLQRLPETEKTQAKDDQPKLFANSLEDLTNEASPTTAVLDSSTPVIISSLTNSNKRRGFKQSMQDVIPQKATFSSPGETPQMTAPIPANRPYTLIPPSQRANLPRNIIVTSVNVEEGVWDESFRKVTEKKTKPKAEMRKDIDDVPNVVLDYSEDGPTPLGGRTEDAFDWAKAEKGFDQYRFAVRGDIVEGRILLWKVRLCYLHPAFCLVHFRFSRSLL